MTARGLLVLDGLERLSLTARGRTVLKAMLPGAVTASPVDLTAEQARLPANEPGRTHQVLPLQ